MLPPGAMNYGAGLTSQVAFQGPMDMEVTWDEVQPGGFDSAPLIAPGRYNFQRGNLYRLRLTNIPGRPGLELYPTLEVAFGTPRSEAYLAHNAIPVYFTEEDFEQVSAGNFVTKVIYLPDAEFQDIALTDVEELVSTRLDPGVDPIEEADRRGAILSIVRLGNKDLLVPGSGGADAATFVQGGGYGDGSFATGNYEGCIENYSGGQGQMLAGLTSGVGMPQYGMPTVGTPIGLPGPPHIPLGGPAGLQKHVMRNHTFQWIPGPTEKQSIHVRQSPGHIYPKPASHAYISERTRTPGGGSLFGGIGARLKHSFQKVHW